MKTGYMLQLNKAVFVEDKIDLDHMLEAVSDATFFAENVTKEEHELVIELISQLKQDKKRKYEN